MPTATPIFPQGVHGWGASIGNSDAQNWKLLLDMAGNGAKNPDGSKIVGLSFYSSDSSARNVAVALVKSGSVTVTSASPGVVTWNNNNLAIGSQVFFNGAPVPTGITAFLPYYVISTGFAAGSTFEIATTPGGSAVNTSSTGTSVIAYAVRIITTIPVAALAGQDGATAAQAFFDATYFPGWSQDNDGNPYYPLAYGDYFAIQAQATVTANKIIEANMWGGDF